LNGYTLRQKGDASFAVGIFITNGSKISDLETVSPQHPALNNITIRNGLVEHMATGAILVNKVNNLTFEDLNLTRNGYSGYILCPCGAQRAGGMIYSSFFPGQIPAPFLNNHIWRNVHCDSNSTTQPNALVFPLQGADISAVDNVIIENCTFNNNSATETFVNALELLNNTNVKISNSQANGNTAITSSATGFAGNLTNFIFENCQANSNSSLVGSVGFDLSPAAVSGPNTFLDPWPLNGTFINCTANGNLISGDGSSLTGLALTYGFSVSFTGSDNGNIASGVKFINCTANNQLSNLQNFGGALQQAYGFVLLFVTDAQLNSCVACQNVAITGNVGDAEGFHLGGYNITLTDCYSELNIGSGGIGNSVQYNVFPGIAGIGYNVNLINCKAIGDPTDATGIGIRLFAANNCVVDGCLIESNGYDGIYLNPVPCGYTANNVIKNNTILAPNPFVFGGPTGVWAIEDKSAPTGEAPSNNYLNNQAYNYPGDGSMPIQTNYNPGVRAAGGVDSSTNGFIATWLVPQAPPSPSSVIPGITNLDVTDTVCSFTGDNEKGKKMEKIREAIKKKDYKMIRELIPEYSKYTAMYNQRRNKKVIPKPISTLK
jgi:hypothetical protein